MRARTKKNRKTEKKQEGSFRIIAGDWRSRRLSFPDVEGLRPSTDRVRETVFNWLASYINGADILDLYAGSGALGFEALSRGAGHCQFIELNSLATTALRSNIQLLNANASLIQTSALEWLQAAEGKYDLVFIDPPFRRGMVQSSIDLLFAKDLLHSRSLVYLEQEYEAALPRWPDGWMKLKEKNAGQVRYCLYGAGASE